GIVVISDTGMRYVVTETIPNTGYYDWTVSVPPGTAQAKLEMEGCGIGYPCRFFETDNYFTIVYPTPTPTPTFTPTPTIDPLLSPTPTPIPFGYMQINSASVLP